ncbi:hypothetical protein SAMN02745121_00965 [Nannocystis exedens]|uniref:Coenzyme Q (Ubiquinone) biosynthesis protein Coq4 n=1 Tax=Nannocystis exedens TaxID=54 RepID=A0A1I1U4D5_9BACT|nr:hypothetical protein [Nannocystis exedens]SFD65672.1 hypothetical protein SAMN02745121_00965 [Nannocystis exedens]
MTQKPAYLAPDCPLTLAEGLEAFAAANPGLLPPGDGELREFIRAHDACHVLFGLGTTVEDEAVADTWTIFGSDVGLRRYASYLGRPEIAGIIQQIGWWNLTAGSARALPRVLRAIVRARRMSAPWPFFDYARSLDVPIAALRRRYNVRPV